MTVRPKSADEYVMVIPTQTLYSAGSFQGLLFETQAHLRFINDEKHIKFLKRADVETNFEYKQIIPYLILAHRRSIFSYSRGETLTERRLRGNYSIGLGGHISSHDVKALSETYAQGMQRELSEEVEIESTYSEKPVALINDDSNEVGKVHFGIVHLFILEHPMVKAREESIRYAKFECIDVLRKRIALYENWSQICLTHFDKLVRAFH